MSSLIWSLVICRGTPDIIESPSLSPTPIISSTCRVFELYSAMRSIKRWKDWSRISRYIHAVYKIAQSV